MGSARDTMRRAARIGGAGLVVWAVADQLRRPGPERTWTGKLAGTIPYDFRRPTADRIRKTFWNPEDDRVLVPQVFGVGWTVNAAAIARRLGI